MSIIETFPVLINATAILQTCLLRRKKDSEINGKPLITLPTMTVELRVLQFSPEERRAYDRVELECRQTFNELLEAG